MLSVVAITSTPDRPERALLCGLAERGVRIMVLTESPHIFAGIGNLEALPLRIKSRLDLKAAGSIRAIVKERGATVVHSFSARALTTALLGTAGLGCRHIAYRGTMGHLSRLDPMAWLSFLNPRIAKISCVSEAVRGYLIAQGVAECKVVTIYKGHSLEWYQRQPSMSRVDLGIPPDAVLCGFLGNMRKVKGADILLAAMDRLPPEANLHLLLIGELRDPQVLLALQSLRRKERIHQLGYRADGAELLRLCDVVVMPSREREGFPKAVIEGMAQGIPAVVSRVGGMPELVEHGSSGLVVEPEDPEGLAQALITLAQSPELRSTLGNQARERIRQNFPIEKTIEQTLALYQEALASKGS